MKKQLLQNMLATIAALFICMFALPQQAQAESYDLKIAGVQVNSDNCNDLTVIPGVSGTVKYDPATKTLTLEDATINATDEGKGGIVGEIVGLTVQVKGTSSVTAQSSALVFWYPVTITGGGTLNATGSVSCGIATKNDLTIDGLTVNAKGEYGIAGYYGSVERLTIKNATVTAEGTNGSIRDFKDITLDGCAITRPAGAAFDASLKGVALNGQLVKEKVEIHQKDTQAPSAPSITSMTSTTNSITVNWSKSTDNMTPQSELRYRVWCGLAGGNEYAGKDIVTNQTSYTVTGLEPDTEYELFVMVFNNADNVARSAMKTIRTKKAVTAYDLSIAGVQVTSDNCNDLTVIPGVSGTVKYDPATKTLTLEDATINATDEDKGGIIGEIDGLTVQVKGTSSVTTQPAALVFNKSATLTGDGTLNATSYANCAIYIGKTSLTIDGCTVNAKANWGIAGSDGSVETLTIKNATVTAEGNGTDGSICDFKDITLDGCAITRPAGAAFDASLKGVALNGQLVEEKVVIEPTGSDLYDVVLESYNGKKVACIKAVREITGLGLKDAKELVESAPCIVTGNLSKSEAETARDKLIAAGGTAKIYPHGTWIPTAIEAVSADVPLKKQGIYNLQGVKMNTAFDRLPAGIYIVDGKKVVKK